MTKKLGRGLSGLAMSSSMLLLSMTPAAAVFAQSPPTATLSASTIIAHPGSSVTFTAATTNVTDPEYQFWVENPSGKWVDAQNYSSTNTFTLSNVQSGNYLVAVEVLTQYQVQHGLWQDALTPLADGVFVNSTVTLSAPNATVVKGQKVTVTAASTHIYSPLYQFWYETPSGVWEQSGNYSASGTFSFTAGETGTYHLIAYAKSPLAVNDPEGALYSNELSQSVGTGVTAVTISGSSFIAAGASAQLTALATESGAAVTSPASVSWTVTSSNGTASGVSFTSPDSLSTAVTVPADDPGTYEVTATVDGVPSAPYAVVAYGETAAIRETASAPTVVADGMDTDTITATATDSLGNAVATYSGTATVHITGTAVTLAASPHQASDVSGNTVTFSHGVATFVVQAGQVPGASATVTISGLTPEAGGAQSSSVSYGTISLSAVPQSATSIAVVPQSSTVSVNQNAEPDSVSVTVDDQAGYPMLGGTYTLSAVVSGGASFTGSSVSQTVYASGDPAATSVTVYGAEGVMGTYVVTVSGSGLTTGTAHIDAIITGVPTDLTASDSAPSFTEGAASGTTVTLGAADASGNTVALPSTVVPQVTITNASGVAVTGLTLVSASGEVAAVSGATYDFPVGTFSFAITDSSGQPDAGSYTVAIRDGESTSPLAPATLTVTELPSSPSTFTMSPVTNVLTPTHLSTELSLQVTDAYGNPVLDNSVPVSVSAAGSSGAASLDGGSYSASPTTTVYTNASGAVQVLFSAQDYTGQWTVTGTVAAGNIASGSLPETKSVTLYVQNDPAASYDFNLEDVSTGTYSDNTQYAQAGDVVTLTPSLVSAGLDANSNPVSASVDGTDQVTATITHAPGLLGLPTSSTDGVEVSLDSNTGTETLTGTLSQVSTLLSSTTLTAGIAGETTVALVDHSTGAQGSAAIDIVAGTTATQLAFAGLTNGEGLSTATPYPVTITLVDGGGNPVVASASQTVTLSASSGMTIENGSGVPISSVNIGAGESSAQFTVVTDQSPEFSNGAVSASDSPADVSGAVTGLTD